MPQPSIRLPWLQFPGRISQAEESGIRAYCAPSSFRTGGPLFRFSERQKEALRVGDAHDQDVVILRRHNDHVRRSDCNECPLSTPGAKPTQVEAWKPETVRSHARAAAVVSDE